MAQIHADQMSMNDSRPPKPKRRCFQFGLRTLLAVTVGLSVLFAWIAFRLQRARQHREAAAEAERLVSEVFEKAGGRVDVHRVKRPGWLGWLLGDRGLRYLLDVSPYNRPGFDDAALEHLIRESALEGLIQEDLHLARIEVTDAGLEHLKQRATFEALDLSRTRVTDAGLQQLKGLTNLVVLNLDFTQVTDAGLEHVKGLNTLKILDLPGTNVRDVRPVKELTNLAWLNLDRTGVGDAALENLSELTSLQRLRLNFTRVTDAGLVHLKTLTNLRELYLNDTQVTDAGLEHLKELDSLDTLCLSHTPVTDEGVMGLQRALPKCRIWH